MRVDRSFGESDITVEALADEYLAHIFDASSLSLLVDD
jgi:hypothetical protein